MGTSLMVECLRLCARNAGDKVWYDAITRTHLHIFDRKRNELKDLVDDGFSATAAAYFKDHAPKGYKVDEIDIQLVCHRSRNSKKL